MKPIILLLSFILLQIVHAQVLNTDSGTVPKPNAMDNTERSAGVAVSPSTLRFNAKPGTLQIKTFKITNDSKRNYQFNLMLQDFAINEQTGSEVYMPKSYRYALSKYLSVSPNFIELKPGEFKNIAVTLDIPPVDTNNISMWTMLIVDQVVNKNKKLELNKANANALAMGINVGMGFGIRMYQNPPNVKITDVEILKLAYAAPKTKKNKGYLHIDLQNMGDGISYCLNYIEMTHFATGKQTKYKVNQLSIMPKNKKQVKFELPAELSSGKYSAVVVIDFGDKDNLQTAEIEFKID